MQRVLDWLKRKGDLNVVSYSRFGLPGEEQDDRPPPTNIHVAPFDEESKHFLVFGTHSQRAAVVTAGIGMSITIFIFLSVFFEMDWYHQTKGVDAGALIGLVLFLLIGLSIHYHIVRGIKAGQGRLLVPFIVIYSMMLLSEAVFFIFFINHWVALSYVAAPREPGAFFAVCITFAVVMLIQGGMLYSVVRCRNYLEKRAIHLLEMRVAEKSKQQFPGIHVVFGAGDLRPPSIAVASQSLGGVASPTNGSAPIGSSAPPPPSYNNSVPPPQRTILQAEDGLV